MAFQARFIHRGDAVDYTPSADVAAGEVVVLNDLVGVAKLDILAGVKGALAASGVFDFAKEAGGGVTFAFGEKGYWDDTNKLAVKTDGGGANKYIGKCAQDGGAADADSSVWLRLSQ